MSASERISVAVDVSGTLWNDRREGDLKYPLYGAFVELGMELGAIDPIAPFPRLESGGIDWQQKDRCVRVYKDVMATLTPQTASAILDIFSARQTANPNIRPTGRQIISMLRALGDRAVTAVISETQQPLVAAYIRSLEQHFGFSVDEVFGSTYHVDPATGRYTGRATRANKGTALASFLNERNLGRLTIAFADDPQADVAMLTAASVGIVVTSEKTAEATVPLGMHVIEEGPNSCTITTYGTIQTKPYGALPQYFMDLIDESNR